MKPARIGASERRVEDDRFITGRGRYVDDIDLARQVYGHVVRSPHGHARIAAIDCTAARGAPGVLCVLTAEDAADDGIGAIPCVMRPTNSDGTDCAAPPRPVLVGDRARMVGDPVAFVVADSPAAARDAAELVDVGYEPLPSVSSAEDALAPGAIALHDDVADNLCVDWELGDRAASEAAIAGAPIVIELAVHNNRVAGCPMEPRTAIGAYDPGTRRYTLETGTQGVHHVRAVLAKHVLGIPEARLEVRTPDVGGAFGVRLWVYPEHALVLWAARKLGRPVKWTAERGEAIATDHQGRDLISRGRLALDGDGRIVALAVDSIANLGAYPSNFGPFIPTAGGTRALVGPYRTPTLHVRVRCAYTNTAPTDAYRGAGRPESVFLLERLIDEAAHQIGIDPADLRRRNFVPSSAMPYKTPLGHSYDSGDFAQALESALEAIGWQRFAGRREAAARASRLRGIGLSSYVDPCGGGRDQWAALRFDPEGAATVLIGSQATGQGHETAYAQIVSDQLGLPLDQIRVIQGDSTLVPFGRGTSGSRSLPIGGNAVLRASEKAVARGMPHAAALLEAAEADVTFARGAYRIAGTNRTVSFAEVLAASRDPARAEDGTDLGLDVHAHHMARAVTFSNGCHVCEVEIERDTGVCRIVRYVAVDDFGRIINPMLVEGQVHGALAQGLGQGFCETVIYDDEDAQLVTGSFMDYTLPRADDLPMFETRTQEIPCATNALGIKGCGEAGAIAAPPAFVNAVVDALRPFGVSHIDMPITSERIWRLLQERRQ